MSRDRKLRQRLQHSIFKNILKSLLPPLRHHTKPTNSDPQVMHFLCYLARETPVVHWVVH